MAVVLGVVVLRRLWSSPPAYTFCAAIALTIFSGGWSEIGLGGLPFNRLLMVVGFLKFVLGAPGTARVPPLRVRNVHILMALASVYVLISATAAGTLTTEDGFLTLSDVFGIVPYLVFFLAPAVFAGDRERRLLLATLVGIGLYLGVTAVLKTLGPRGLVFPSYIIHTDMAGTGTIEASGPFQSPVAMGFAVYACGVAALDRLLPVARAVEQAPGAAECRSAPSAASPRSTAGSGSPRSPPPWPGRWSPAPGGAGSCRAPLPARSPSPWCSPSPRNWRAAPPNGRTTTSASGTADQTSAGLRMVASKPLFGFGWDGYRADSLAYFRQPGDYPMTGYAPGVTIGLPQHVTPLHNTYLAYAVELGLVGWMLWLGSLVAAVVVALAPRPAGAAPVEARPDTRCRVLRRGRLLRPARPAVSRRWWSCSGRAWRSAACPYRTER